MSTTGGAAAPTALLTYNVNRKRIEASSELKWTRKRTESSFKWTCTVNTKRTESLCSLFTLRWLSTVLLKRTLHENTLNLWHFTLKLKIILPLWVQCQFLTFMPLSLISLMRFPGLVVASKWNVYWLAPAAAMGFTHCSGRDTIMCMSATLTQSQYCSPLHS